MGLPRTSSLPRYSATIALIASLLPALAAAQPAAAEPLIPDGWYTSIAREVDGAAAVCPPGKKPDLGSGCEDGAPVLSPKAYLQRVCPGAQLVSLQPFYQNKLFVLYFLMGYKNPEGKRCPTTFEEKKRSAIPSISWRP